MLKVGNIDFHIIFAAQISHLGLKLIRCCIPCQVKGRFEHNVDVTIVEDGQVAMLPQKCPATTSVPNSAELHKVAAREESWPTPEPSLCFEEPLKTKLSFEGPLVLRTSLNTDHLVEQLPQL